MTEFWMRADPHRTIWMRADPHRTMKYPVDGRCVAEHGNARCPFPAAALVTTGCVHEHMIADAAVCMDCLEIARHSDSYWCWMCHESPERAHRCAVHVLTWKPL